MPKNIVVIKIGGEIIGQHDNFKLLCKEIVKLKQANTKIVIVHGGGQQVNDIETKLGNIPNIVNGRRITDEKALDSIKMVIAGKINIEVVSTLQCHGVSAIGLTGVDANTLQVCRRSVKAIDYGLVGEIKKVNAKLIVNLLAQGITPVIAPLGSDENGTIYNINADTVASAIALSVNASQWLIFTNTDGIYDKNGQTISQLSSDQAHELISEGVISGGMIPKVESILLAINAGIQSVHIINGFKPEKFSKFHFEKSCGTLITNAL